MYIHTYLHIHISIRIHIHVCTKTYTYTCTYTCTCTYTYTHTHTHTGGNGDGVTRHTRGQENYPEVQALCPCAFLRVLSLSVCSKLEPLNLADVALLPTRAKGSMV
jgi:hypothetical protein